MFMPKVVRIDVDVASSQKNKGFVVTRSRSGGQTSPISIRENGCPVDWVATPVKTTRSSTSTSITQRTKVVECDAGDQRCG